MYSAHATFGHDKGQYENAMEYQVLRPLFILLALRWPTGVEMDPPRRLFQDDVQLLHHYL